MVRAKFMVTVKQTAKDAGYSWSNGGIVNLSAVVDGSEENKQFFEATPSGQLQMHINSEAFEAFEEGKQYYLDFTPAE